jgi:hypothetical protein
MGITGVNICSSEISSKISSRAQLIHLQNSELPAETLLEQQQLRKMKILKYEQNSNINKRTRTPNLKLYKINNPGLIQYINKQIFKTGEPQTIIYKNYNIIFNGNAINISRIELSDECKLMYNNSSLNRTKAYIPLIT